jgi:ferritin-like metal-binding protein YciE
LAATTGTKRLVAALEDAHALETRTIEALTSLAESAPDTKLRDVLEQHRDETAEIRSRLEAALVTLGHGTSMRKERQAVLTAALKGFTGSLRDDASPHNLKDWYVTEHSELATFAILSRAADRLGYRDIAQLSRDATTLHRNAAEAAAGWFDYLVELMIDVPE